MLDGWKFLRIQETYFFKINYSEGKDFANAPENWYCWYYFTFAKLIQTWPLGRNSQKFFPTKNYNVSYVYILLPHFCILCGSVDCSWNNVYRFIHSLNKYMQSFLLIFWTIKCNNTGITRYYLYRYLRHLLTSQFTFGYIAVYAMHI